MTMRGIGRLARLLAVLAFCLVGYTFARIYGGQQAWVPRFLGMAARAVGARVRVAGRPLDRDALFVCNHISWIEILALGGVTGAAFVSKAEVADWPVAGWLARIGGTIFIRRDTRAEAAGQADTLRAALTSGRPVALFPEGTTGDGTALLPFRASLFAAVAPPPAGVRVQPVAIDYGEATREVAWVGGEGAGANAWRLLGRRGRLAVTLSFLDPVAPAGRDRKAIAGAAADAIASALTARGVG